MKQVPKEFVQATLQGLHVEGRVVQVEGSHRDKGTENKRELTCKEIFSRGSRLFKIHSK